MSSGTSPTARRVLLSALAALVIGLGGLSLVAGMAGSYPLRVLQVLAIAGAAILVLALAVTLASRVLGDSRAAIPEEEFDRIVERSERLAREGADGDEEDAFELPDDDPGFDVHDEEDFKTLVTRALDDLPTEHLRALEGVAVVVSDGGRRRGAYGLYHGGTVARDDQADRIVIYRDTLLRDFGHDPDLLRAQVTRTVRHEIAHHLGWDEAGVRELGL